MEGKGTMIWRNGSIYQGFIKNDAKHGLGKFTDKQGNTYTGDFFDNEYHGQGILIFTNKDSEYPEKESYAGEFYKGHFQGYGEHRTAYQEFYKGMFLNNQKCGLGFLWLLQDNEGLSYQGEF